MASPWLNQFNNSEKANFGFTTGNFTSFNISSDALEKAKKLFESPNSQKSRQDLLTPSSQSESTPGYQKNMLESPSTATITTKEERPTEECDKKVNKPISSSVKAALIQHNRGELSYESSIQPKFVKMINSSKLTTTVKRRPDSPPMRKPVTKKSEKSEKTTLLDLSKNKPPKNFFQSLGLLVKAENAENFVFKCKCYTKGCSCSETGMMWEDFFDILISEGLKVSKEWVRHHYRLVIWKYASYERKIEACEGILSVPKVLESLKNRYEVEVVQAKRSILKRIVEGDDMAYKRMVLCVGVIKNFGNYFTVELTDGWNSVFTDILSDSLFYPLVQRKTLCQGLKIEVFGSSLQEGKLVLSYNSVRRAAWHRNLGETRSPIPFPVCISSIKDSGGIIGRITVYISRIYPLLFFENNSIKSKFSSNEPTSCFFDCIVKDGLVDYTSKKVSSALITIKHNALEIFENIKLGGLVNFYFTLPQVSSASKSTNRRSFIFNHRSKISYQGKERKDMIKIRKIVDNKTKNLKEVDIIGIVTFVQRTHSNEVCSLSLAGVNGNMKVVVHNPSFFGRVLNIIECSKLNYTKYLAFLNVYVESKKNPVIEIRTSNYTEIVHNNFPSHMMHQFTQLKDLNMNALLSHREECDHFGCVCGFE